MLSAITGHLKKREPLFALAFDLGKAFLEMSVKPKGTECPFTISASFFTYEHLLPVLIGIVACKKQVRTLTSGVALGASLRVHRPHQPATPWVNLVDHLPRAPPLPLPIAYGGKNKVQAKKKPCPPVA